MDILLDEDAWVLVATVTGLFAAIVLVVKLRRRQVSTRTKVTSTLNLFLALWIGIMGTGPLFAVTAKSILGTLPPNIHLWIAIPFGFAIAIPGWWLFGTGAALTRGERAAITTAILLNGWLALVLVIPATPVAGFAVLNLVLLTWQRKGTSRRLAAI